MFLFQGPRGSDDPIASPYLLLRASRRFRARQAAAYALVFLTGSRIAQGLRRNCLGDERLRSFDPQNLLRRPSYMWLPQQWVNIGALADHRHD